MSNEWIRRVRITSLLMIVIGLLNFLVFVAISLYLGGDAVNGKAEGGHYYLYGYGLRTGLKGYTEVTEQVFNYSKWHVYSIFITWPLVMVGGVVGNRIQKKLIQNRIGRES